MNLTRSQLQHWACSASEEVNVTSSWRVVHWMRSYREVLWRTVIILRSTREVLRGSAIICVMGNSCYV